MKDDDTMHSICIPKPTVRDMDELIDLLKEAREMIHFLYEDISSIKDADATELDIINKIDKVLKI